MYKQQTVSNKKERSKKMAYKKPQIVAKSEAKQVYVAGCPTNLPASTTACTSLNIACQCFPVK